MTIPSTLNRPAPSARRWVRALAVAACGLSLAVAQAGPILFHAIQSVSSATAGSDFFAASNLIEGAGVGFDANAPHNRLSNNTWVTAACSYPCDYFASGRPVPVLTFDLGQDRLLSEISVWGYGHPNSASRFSLQFATQSDGLGGFGASIAYNPTFSAALQEVTMQEFDFSQVVTARYVRMRLTDNYYSAANAGAGGDRVGLSEVAFGQRLPEPASLALVGAGLLAVALGRRRTR